MSSPKTPPEFDYYAIDRVLGEGGMGLVYLAHDRRTGLPVAIKVMSKRVFDPALQARFLKENRILSTLNHRNIVRCYEITQSRTGIPSIVMEYVDGVDVRAFEGRPYPELLPLMIQALMGLTYLRSQNVLHRDLSSNNIFVTLENRKRLTKILDFGVAKLLQDQAPDTDVKTQTGQFLGKFAFASPELFLSSQVDWRSDVFSLGVIFHRLLTTKPPITVARRSNYFDWLMAHQEERRYEVEAPAGVPSLPGELADVVRRMLARKPDDRPQSYEEIIDVLHRVQLAVPAALEPDPVALGALPPPVAEPVGSSGGRTARTPTPAPASREVVARDFAPSPPPEAPLPVEEAQQKRWPDLEKTIEAVSAQSPLASEPLFEPAAPPSSPEPAARAEEPLPLRPGLPGVQTDVPLQTVATPTATPPPRPPSGPDQVPEKTERFDDVLAKLRQEAALHPPPPPSPLPSPLPSPSPPPAPAVSAPSPRAPETLRPEAGRPGGAAERKAEAFPAAAGRRLVIYGEPGAPAAAPAPPRVARPVAVPPVPGPPPAANRSSKRWLGVGLIVAAIVVLFVAVLWGLIVLLRGASSGSSPRSSLAVPHRAAALAALPRPDLKSF